MITLRFRGVLNDQLAGFYRSTFTDDAGETRVIATTQFEATDARRAFPCFDEPDRKAVFGVTLDVPAGLGAWSNGRLVSESPLPGGGRRITFADTISMSTYLVAFVVGPLEQTPVVDADGVALSVVHPPGRAGLTAFALEAGAHALRFFTNWFGIPYPGDKLDLVAIPDFAFGAMENLGCVTFRETALLVDPGARLALELERVADVVAHEIAHMWFGDLVTMRWWNGIWLNEAFATFMATMCTDDFRPAWKRWVSFGSEREAAMATDVLHSTRPVEYPVGPPEEAQGMFDVLTYQKGCGVLRMLERFLGAEPFRDGIRRLPAAAPARQHRDERPVGRHRERQRHAGASGDGHVDPAGRLSAGGGGGGRAERGDAQPAAVHARPPRRRQRHRRDLAGPRAGAGPGRRTARRRRCSGPPRPPSTPPGRGQRS